MESDVRQESVLEWGKVLRQHKKALQKRKPASENHPITAEEVEICRMHLLWYTHYLSTFLSPPPPPHPMHVAHFCTCLLASSAWPPVSADGIGAVDSLIAISCGLSNIPLYCYTWCLDEALERHWMVCQQEKSNWSGVQKWTSFTFQNLIHWTARAW